ncbi:MAG: glycosyltransferase family 2 protein [Butyrivibrio sp.]|nr:glycosyltransferase family 2 protein [Butyrivibrio sp.]
MTDLSIIVPVYNGEKYLGQLLESICAIKAVSTEILMIDDGSTDTGAEIIRDYQKQDMRIVYYHKENGGIVSARNYGLSRASGEYLFFADQDDIIEALALEKAILKMKETKADMLLFSTEYIDDAGKKRACDTVFEEGSYTEKEIGDIFIRKLVTRYAEKEVVSYIGHIWAAVISRKLVMENNICFKRFMAIEDDLLFVLDSLDYAKLLLTMRDVGYYWRQNPDSRTRKGRYTEDLPQKKRKYYEYRTKILKRHGVCTGEELEQYYTGVRQEFILDILDNEGLRNIRRAYPALRQLMNNEEIREALLKHPECPLAQRYRVEKRQLAKNKVFLALFHKKWKYVKGRLGNSIRGFLHRRNRRL